MKIHAKDRDTVRHRTSWLASIVIGLSLLGAAGLMSIRGTCAQPQQQVSYSQDLVPIFRGYCSTCHYPGGEGYQASGFDLSTYEGLMKGTKFGPMVIAGNPDTSNLIHLVEGRAKLGMPLNHKPLPNCLRQELWTWIFQGAKDN